MFPLQPKKKKNLNYMAVCAIIVPVIWVKMKPCKKLHFKNIIKCFKEAKIYKWLDLTH